MKPYMLVNNGYHDISKAWIPSRNSLWGGGDHKRTDMKLAWRKKEAWKGLCRVFSSSPDLVSGLSADRKRVGRKNKESVWRTRAWLHLAGVPAQLLPARRLILLWLRAGVGAPVEGRHRAAFAVCVKAAVRRVVCLAVPFGLLECTHCESTITKWINENLW